MNENHELLQKSDELHIGDSPMHIGENAEAISFGISPQKKYNPRFVGMILAWLLPGAAHVLSGRWKAGLFWFLGFFVAIVLFISTLSIPYHLPSVIIIGIELLPIIYCISLFISSYRPTMKLGCGGWFMLFLFIVIIQNTTIVPASLLVKTNIGAASRTCGTSMFPTIQSRSWYNTDRLVSNHWFYHFRSPSRGDIVRFWMELESGKKANFVKRVVGLPGETIDIRSPYVFINGKKLLEPPIFDVISSREGGYSGFCEAKDMGISGITLPITLGVDEYFVMGDNSYHSMDSRFFGPVQRKVILSKIIVSDFRFGAYANCRRSLIC